MKILLVSDIKQWQEKRLHLMAIQKGDLIDLTGSNDEGARHPTRLTETFYLRTIKAKTEPVGNRKR